MPTLAQRPGAPCLALIFAVVLIGCGESEIGTIDIGKSKSIAETRGISRKPVSITGLKAKGAGRNAVAPPGPPIRSTSRGPGR